MLTSIRMIYVCVLSNVIPRRVYVSKYVMPTFHGVYMDMSFFKHYLSKMMCFANYISTLRDVNLAVTAELNPTVAISTLSLKTGGGALLAGVEIFH